MKKFALIGEDIAYSYSKKIHERIFEFAGVKASYDIISVKKHDFDRAIKEILRGYDGFNVTKPYKNSVAPYLGSLDASAKACGGAVNTVFGGTGYNTDGEGFLRGLDYHNIETAGADILVLGAGGAAAAVLAALSGKKCGRVYIYNRSMEKAESLIAGFAARGADSFPVNILNYSGLSKLKTDIIVNCTSAGLKEGDCPLPDNYDFSGVKVCHDLIYNPPVTKLMTISAAAGVRTSNGAAMLAYQAAAAEKIWNGIDLTAAQINVIIKETLGYNY